MLASAFLYHFMYISVIACIFTEDDSFRNTNDDFDDLGSFFGCILKTMDSELEKN